MILILLQTHPPSKKLRVTHLIRQETQGHHFLEDFSLNQIFSKTHNKTEQVSRLDTLNWNYHAKKIDDFRTE